MIEHYTFTLKSPTFIQVIEQQQKRVSSVGKTMCAGPLKIENVRGDYHSDHSPKAQVSV